MDPTQDDEIKDPAPGGATPDSIGGFRILKRLATGGMGTVYLAEQREPVRRRVALKVIRAGLVSDSALRRFELERQVLALMDHDSIAKIHEAGTTGDGEPFFVMEFVAGRPITEYCDVHRLTNHERLELFEPVCAAVQHAHQRGIIHRDLKPANILVGDSQGHAVPKIIDFGLARAPDRQLVDATVFTQFGTMVGTPAYMSPEQADMSSEEVDSRADVYALGVILYELLTGTLPITVEELGNNVAEMSRRISEIEPPRPSDRLSSLDETSTDVAKCRKSSVAALARSLRSDLDWVVMKAIDRERNRRYSSASELAADIRRHLNHQPVLAGPPSLGYLLRKFVRRNRVAVAFAATVLALLAIGAGVATVLLVQARQSLDRFNLVRYRIELDDAVEAAKRLYPPWPDRVPALERWLRVRADPLESAGAFVAAALSRTDPEADSTQRFLATTLSRLNTDLAGFTAAGGLMADVRSRLEWARRIEQLSITRHRARWDQASSAIAAASEDGGAYSERPVELTPLMGLVPIGENPETGLYEFYHLASAADPEVIPTHDAGDIVMDEAMGIVFVLIPGGSFPMGAQRTDRSAMNYDPFAEPPEGPPRRVTAEPCLLAKHELTQAQWLRLSNQPNPSRYRPAEDYAGAEPITLLHPVENVNWLDTAELLRQYGLRLPTEREWARACRADTTTPWFSGADASSLAGHANVVDRSAAAIYPTWGEDAGFDDRYVYHAPAGSFLPNPYGLYDMLGNVSEWCQPIEGDPERTARGGAFNFQARFTRSASRFRQAPDYRAFVIGVRPARSLDG